MSRRPVLMHSLSSSADDRRHEFPHGVAALLNEARERSPLGVRNSRCRRRFAVAARALQLDTRGVRVGPEAMAGLEEVIADDSVYVAATVALETFLSRYIAAILDPSSAPELVAPDARKPPPCRLRPCSRP